MAMSTKKKTSGDFSVAWSEKGESAIKIADGLFEEGNTIFADAIREATGQESPRIFLVADANVVQKTEQLGVKIGRTLSAAGMEIAGSPVILPGGERVKNDDSATVRRIAGAAFGARLSRNDVLVAIGGGTIIDVAGFAAAQVRGGMKFAAVPTTVVAAVDSIFMTDAAVDAAGVKDAMRVRSRPSVAFIDANFTKTTLDGVWRGGIGALVRHAASSDGALFKRIVSSLDALKARDHGTMSELLSMAVASRVKKGPSNFGLWAAMRLESMSGFKLPYGYSVPMGMCIDCAYGVKIGALKEDDASMICSTLETAGALEGFSHSHHIIGRVHHILRGLDTWRLSGYRHIEVPCGIGKKKEVPEPDRGIYGEVLDELVGNLMNPSKEGDQKPEEED